MPIKERPRYSQLLDNIFPPIGNILALSRSIPKDPSPPLKISMFLEKENKCNAVMPNLPSGDAKTMCVSLNDNLSDSRDPWETITQTFFGLMKNICLMSGFKWH